MSRRLILSLFCLSLAAPAARAETRFSDYQLPSRTALDRLGLERHWAAVVPVSNHGERVLRISLAGSLLVAQTNQAHLHTFEAETGATSGARRSAVPPRPRSRRRSTPTAFSSRAARGSIASTGAPGA